MPSSILVGIAIAAFFYLFVLVWGVVWLIALISFRRILQQTIHENTASAYTTWLNPISPQPNTV